MADNSNASSLDFAVLRAVLGAAPGFAIDAVASCDSTNTRLLALAETGAPSGSVLVADRQTAGRGRRGRIWHSAPRSSLTFSLLWRFAADSSAPVALSLAVGLAVAQALEFLGARDVALKWPNDVLHHGRKLAGILVELQSGQPRSAVIGIGLNLALPRDLPGTVAEAATGLDTVIGAAPGRETVLAALLTNLERTLDRYARSGFGGLRAEWLARHAFQDQLVRVDGDRSRHEGRCLGIAADGALLLASDAGMVRIVAGELSLRPASGAAK